MTTGVLTDDSELLQDFRWTCLKGVSDEQNGP